MLEADGSRVTWLYDATYQLTGENRTGTSGYRHTFTYDSRGNRTLKNESGSRTTYAYDPANQLRSGQAAVGRTTYTFDASGNQQIERSPSGSRVTVVWDYESQPTRYHQTANTTFPIVTMAYNGDNQRTAKQISSGTTRFIWDERNYLAEADSGNTITSILTTEPTHFGGLVSSRIGGVTYFHAFDALSSTRHFTLADATTVASRIYGAWGDIIGSTGAAPIPLLWTGELQYYFDVEILSYAVRRRIFRPSLARWLSRDPVLVMAILSFYKYAGNRPAMDLDPSGLQSPAPGAPMDQKNLQKRCSALRVTHAWMTPTSAYSS